MMALHLSLLLCASSSIVSAFVGPSSNSVLLTTTSSWKETKMNKMGHSMNCPPLNMVEDEDENNPLSRGINSVGWLPSVYNADPSRSGAFVSMDQSKFVE